MATPTHWLEYGEPTGDNRVRATKRVTYETGPNELRADTATQGTIPMKLLDLIEGHEHQHEDGSLLLSALDDEERERIDDAFEPCVTARVDPHEIVEKEVNDNGQIYVGRDLSGKTVKVAYEILDDDPDVVTDGGQPQSLDTLADVADELRLGPVQSVDIAEDTGHLSVTLDPEDVDEWNLSEGQLPDWATIVSTSIKSVDYGVENEDDTRYDPPVTVVRVADTR